MATTAAFHRSAISVWKKNHVVFTTVGRFVDVRALSTTASSSSSSSSTFGQILRHDHVVSPTMMIATAALVMTTAAATLVTSAHTTKTANDDNNASSSSNNHSLTPSQVATVDFDELVSGHSASQMSKMPIFTADQVAENNGDDDKPIWVSYGTCCLFFLLFLNHSYEQTLVIPSDLYCGSLCDSCNSPPPLRNNSHGFLWSWLLYFAYCCF
jgi:hypothetical protein